MKKIFYLINLSFFKRFFIVLFLFSFFVFVSAISYVDAVSTDISNSVFRLHVIANSDSQEDQELKYKNINTEIKFKKWEQNSKLKLEKK